MLLRFSDAKSKLARHVREGKCPTDPEVAEDINEAQNLLLQEANWKDTLLRICIKVTNNCFTLPREAETVVKMNECHRTGNVFSSYYEFLDGGPGTLDFGNTVIGKDLMDMGGNFPTFFPIAPNELDDSLINVLALSTDIDDVGKQIRLRGFGTYKEDVYDDEREHGETITIGRFQDGVEGAVFHNDVPNHLSKVKYQELYSVIKPATKGYITLYGYTHEGSSVSPNVIFLSKYHPRETSPCYRRYRVTGSTSACTDSIVVLAKARHVELSEDDDILLIQHVPALRMMVKALHEIDFGDFQKGILLQQNAIRMLNRQLSNTRPPSNEFDVQFDTHMVGVSTNLI